MAPLASKALKGFSATVTALELRPKRLQVLSSYGLKLGHGVISHRSLCFGGQALMPLRKYDNTNIIFV